MDSSFRMAVCLAGLLCICGCMAPPPASIGFATMDTDGTIRLQLMARGDRVIGDAVLIYKPADPQYQDIKKHLGGLNPGEEKPVPPWPDKGH